MNKEIQEKLMNACRDVISNVCSSDTTISKAPVDNCLSDIILQIRIEKTKTNDSLLSKDNFSIEFLNCSNVNIKSSPTLQPENFGKSSNDFLLNDKFNREEFTPTKKISVKDLTFWFNQKKLKNEFNKKLDNLGTIKDNVDQKYLKTIHFAPNYLQNKSVQTEDLVSLISNRLAALPEEVLTGAFNYLSRSENLTNYGRTISNNNEHENIVVSINFSNTIKLLTLFLAVNTIVLLKFILWEQFSNFFF